MAKVAEKLFILKQHSEALLQRLYTIKTDLNDNELKPDVMKSTTNVDMKRLFTRLLKDAPQLSMDELEKIQGYDWVQNNMTTLFNQVHPIYTTFKEILQWTEHAQQTINEMATNANIEFVQDVNFLTCYDYLQMLVGYVKLILLLNRIKDKELVVCLFNLSYFKLNGSSEPNIQRVWQLFRDFENPIPKFQERWFTIQDQVGKALIGLIPAFERVTFQNLNLKRPLEMLSEPDRIPFPAVEETYQYLSSYQELVEWISIIYSCCPDALTRTPDKIVKITPVVAHKKKKEIPIRCYEILLQRVLVNNLVICLYGDEVYNIHEAYKEYVMIKKFPELKKESKTLKEVSEIAAEKCHDYHKELRNYLRLQLKSLLNMMKDSPGLLGPKLNLVLAAISMAKSEIMWYFNHNGYVPKTGQRKFKEVKETHISEMIYLVDEMIYVCMIHKEVIRKYSLNIMRGLYYNKLKGLIEENKARLDQAKVLHVMDSILNDIQTTEDFEAMRLNWRRLEAFLSGYQFKQALTEHKTQQLFNTMMKIVVFSKHVDGLYEELVELGSLKQLYYYKNDVDTIFTEGLYVSKSQALYSTAFIRILNTYPDNIHPKLNANLRNKIGNICVGVAEVMMDKIVKRIIEALDKLNSNIGYRMLMKQIGGEVAAIQILKKYGSKKNNYNNVDDQNVPGLESHFENNTINEMRELERNMTQLLFSLSRYEEIIVYDTVFYPVEYLRSVLEEYVSEYIKKITSTIEMNAKTMKNDLLPPKFITPSELLGELNSFMSSLKVIEQCANINTEELVMNAFLEQFVNLDYVDSSFTVVKSGESLNTICVYAQWFTELVSDPQKYRTVYYPNRQTFVSTSNTPIQSYNVEGYVDYTELKAFAQLCGPYGVRVLNQYLLNEIYVRCEKLREVLSQTNNQLKDVESKIYDDKFIIDKKLRSGLLPLEPAMTILIQLGGMFEFRENLQKALQTCVRRNIPAIYDVVDAAYQQYPPNYYGDPKYLTVDSLATDCGFNDVDHSLRLKIAPLVDRSQVWEVLPLAFAALTLLEKTWKDSYDVNLEGWSTNIHLSINAFHKLMTAVHSIKSNNIKELEKDYNRFAEFSAMLLLHMRGTRGFERQTDSCTIFIDRTVKTAKHLEMSVFEDLLPYPLIRTTYVKTFEPHQAENDIAVENVVGTNQNINTSLGASIPATSSGVNLANVEENQ
ncbi:hypothetical protein ABK040_001973 [Willaertia magna]